MANDPRFADIHKLTHEVYEELAGHLAAGVARFTAQEVVERFREQDMMAVPVQGHRQAFQDPQVLHNQMILEAEHPQAGAMKLVGFPIKLSDTPARLGLAPPLLGEHTRDVLSELLGMADNTINELAEAGAIGMQEVSE